MASQIEELLPQEETAPIEEPITDNAAIVYEYGSRIPDILIKNATYQEAAVIGSLATTSESTVTISDPGEALVNIYCTYRTPDYIRTNTGSGVIVSDSGVILTNANGAMVLLLEADDSDNKTECIVRSGIVATAT